MKPLKAVYKVRNLKNGKHRNKNIAIINGNLTIIAASIGSGYLNWIG